MALAKREKQLMKLPAFIWEHFFWMKRQSFERLAPNFHLPFCLFFVRMRSRRVPVIEGGLGVSMCSPDASLRWRGGCLRCPAWQGRDSVCAGAVFVGPVVQSARFHDCRFARNRSKSFWRYSPALVSFPRAVRECQSLISWKAPHFERFACRCNVIFRDRRSTLELVVQISWQHFRAFRADFVAGAVLSSLRADVVAGAALWVGRIALAVARCTF